MLRLASIPIVAALLVVVFSSQGTHAQQQGPVVAWEQACAGRVVVNPTNQPGTLVVQCLVEAAVPTPTVETVPTIPAVPTATAPVATTIPVPTATTVPTNVPVPTPTTAPSRPSTGGIWTSAAELQSIPTSGTGWNSLVADANSNFGSPNLADLDSNHDVKTLAAALVYARTGDGFFREKAANAIKAMQGTEAGSRGLEVSRNIQSYVFAADLINLAQYRPAEDATFRNYISALRTKKMSDGRTIISTHEDRPNNWGTHAGAARIAIDLYLGDRADLNRAVQVFQGWLGDRSKYSGFDYDQDLSWQADKSAPVGVNPSDTFINGKPVGGVLPEDQRRGGSFSWPPPCEGYVPEAMQGVVVQAEMLYRAGFDAYAWSNHAVGRASDWYTKVAKCSYEGDDTWIPWVLNKRYSTTQIPLVPARTGKNMGYTDFTHQ